MPDDPYTIGDLSRLADVTPRTVRYYLAQGLLPSPEAAGPATRYGEAHLARLRLIKRLQRSHLPLAEIRLRLERLRDDEVIATVSALEARTPEPTADANNTLAFVRELMARSGIQATTSAGPHGLELKTMSGATLEEAWAGYPPTAGSVPAPASAPAPGAAPRPGAHRMVDAPRGTPPSAPARPSPPPAEGPAAPLALASMAPPADVAEAVTVPVLEPQRIAPDRSTWERLVISPDVELHVRRPLDRRTNKRVDQLERIARELFEDD